MDRDVAGLIVRLRQLARHASISFAQDGSYSVGLRDIGGNPGPGVYRSGSNYDRSFEDVLESAVVKGEQLVAERSPAIKRVESTTPSITRDEMDALDRLRPSSIPVDATAGFVELRMDPYAPKLKLTAKRVVRRKVFDNLSGNDWYYMRTAAEFAGTLAPSDLINIAEYDRPEGSVVVSVWYWAAE